MATDSRPEVWLRGAVPEIPGLLQPVAHCLLQCREELHATIPRLSAEQLWTSRTLPMAPSWMMRTTVRWTAWEWI